MSVTYSLFQTSLSSTTLSFSNPGWGTWHHGNVDVGHVGGHVCLRVDGHRHHQFRQGHRQRISRTPSPGIDGVRLYQNEIDFLLGGLCDVDADGYDATGTCGGTDCDDNDPSINPGATETAYDGIARTATGRPDRCRRRRLRRRGGRWVRLR